MSPSPTRSRWALALLLGALVALPGCGALDNAFDCQAICGRYETCFDTNYDVGACAERCRTDSAADPEYKRRADVCNACIDDRACSSATFSCAASCGSIVP